MCAGAVSRNAEKIFSPITHVPMHNSSRASATARASSLKGQLNNSAVNFTKTTIQARADGMVKPKAYNAWDILALNDLIKGRIEDQNRKQKEHKERIEMRKFYDQQVQEKKQ